MDWLAFLFCVLIWALHVSNTQSQGSTNTEFAINVPWLRKSTCQTPTTVDKCIECTCDDGVQTCRNVCDTLGYRRKGSECFSGQPIPDPDGCNTCICFEGEIHCTRNQCDYEHDYEGKECTIPKYILKPDGCNFCFCSPEGRLKCSNEICIPEFQCSKDKTGIFRPDSCNVCACVNNRLRCTANKCLTAITEPRLPPALSLIIDPQIKTRFQEDEGQTPLPHKCTNTICCHCLKRMLAGYVGSSSENYDDLFNEDTQNQKNISRGPLFDIIAQICSKNQSTVEQSHAYHGYKQEAKLHSNSLSEDKSKLIKILATSSNNPTLGDISDRFSSSQPEYAQKNYQSNNFQNLATEYLIKPPSIVNYSTKLITASPQSNQTNLVVPDKEPLYQDSFLPTEGRHEIVSNSVSLSVPEYPKDIDKVFPFSDENEKLSNDYSSLTINPMDEPRIISNSLQFGPSDQHTIIPVMSIQSTEGIANNKIQSLHLVPQNVPNAEVVTSDEYHQYKPIESRIISSENSAKSVIENNYEKSMIDEINQIIQHTSQTQLEPNPATYNLNQLKQQEDYQNPNIPQIHENNIFESLSLQKSLNQYNDSSIQAETESDLTSQVILNKIEDALQIKSPVTGSTLVQDQNQLKDISITNYHDMSQIVPNYNFDQDVNRTPQNTRIPPQSNRGSSDFHDNQYLLNRNPSLQINHQPNVPALFLLPPRSQFKPRSPYTHNVHERRPRPVFVPNQARTPMLHNNIAQSQLYHRLIPTSQNFQPSNNLIAYRPNSPNLIREPLKLQQFPHGDTLVHGSTYNGNLHSGETTLYKDQPYEYVALPDLTDPLLAEVYQQKNGRLNGHPRIHPYTMHPNIQSQPHNVAHVPLKHITQMPKPARPILLPQKQIAIQQPSAQHSKLVWEGQRRPLNPFRYPHYLDPNPSHQKNFQYSPSQMIPNRPVFGSSELSSEIQYSPRPTRPVNFPYKRPENEKKQYYNKPDQMIGQFKQQNGLYKSNNYESIFALMPGQFPNANVANQFQNQGAPRPNLLPGVTDNPKSPVTMQYVVSDPPKGTENIMNHKYPDTDENEYHDNQKDASLLVQSDDHDQYISPSSLESQVNDIFWNNNNENLLQATTSDQSLMIKLDSDHQQEIDKIFNDYEDMSENQNSEIDLEMKSSYKEYNSAQNQDELPLTDSSVSDIEENKDVYNFVDEFYKVTPNPIQDEPVALTTSNNPFLNLYSSVDEFYKVMPNPIQGEPVALTTSNNPSLDFHDQDEQVDAYKTTTDFEESLYDSVSTNGQSPQDFGLKLNEMDRSNVSQSSNPQEPSFVKRMELNETTTATTANWLENITEEIYNTTDSLSTLSEFSENLSTANNIVDKMLYSSITTEELQTIINDVKSELESKVQFDNNNETDFIYDRFLDDAPTFSEDGGMIESAENLLEIHTTSEDSNVKDIETITNFKEIDSTTTVAAVNLETSLLPKIFNSRVIYKQKDQIEECGEGTQWIRNCYGCSCENGKAVCYKLPACVLRSIGEPMTCKPYSRFKMGDCYTCVCNGDGVAECDSTGCTKEIGNEMLAVGEKPNNPEDSTEAGSDYKQYYDEKKTDEQYYSSDKKLSKECTKQIVYPTCEPGTSWISACHRCECKNNSRHECTPVDGCELDVLRKGKPSRCKPNSKFYPKTTSMPCVECYCNDEGIPYCPTPNK
ncbi:hypothetical protein B5X24_HaOG215347 [Helicoverpa armigera]|nr:hypothetical protein B5X24_HaOG215347 [Helicoverpa armigera]